MKRICILEDSLKILLINPESKQTVNYFPTGLCYLSSYIKKFSVRKTDIKIHNSDEFEAKSLIEFIPDIIGISSFTHNFHTSVNLSRYFRTALPDSLILLGGCHISVLPESLDGEFDYAVIGEGEHTFLDIINNYSKNSKSTLENIPGISPRNNSNVIQMKNDVGSLTIGDVQHLTDVGNLINRRGLIKDLDTIPFPDRESIEDVEHIIKAEHPGWFGKTGLRSMQLTTSRGCPYKCIFCQPSVMWEKYRMNSPAYIADEIEYIHKKFAINAILIEDDLFTGSKKRVIELVELLGKKDLLGKIIYYIAGRTSQIDEQWAEILKSLGVFKVEFGIESGSDKVAQYLKTGKTSTDVNKRAISILNAYGIGVFASFIAGAPIETKEDLNETRNMIKWIKKNHSANTCGLGIATPLPATGLWDYAVSEGLIDLKNIQWSKLSVLKNFPKRPDEFIHLNKNMPADYLLNEIKKINFYLKLGTPSEFIKAIPRRVNKLLKRILKRIISFF
ncbi:MAG: B12-binding protein [Ignavibacteria bacterium]|nr:B12-binding protein [Ignavibacteria bacterium]